MTNRKNLQKSLAIILSVVMILSLLPVMSVNAASKKSKRKSDHIHYALALNDHGWTGVDIYYSVTERYSVSGSKVTFEYRSLYAYAIFGRPKWDNPYNFRCSNIWHEDKKGHTLNKFKMYDAKYSIFPGVGYGQSISTTEKESFKNVSYPKNNNYKGAFNLNITAQYCLNPFSKTIKYSLKG